MTGAAVSPQPYVYYPRPLPAARAPGRGRRYTASCVLLLRCPVTPVWTPDHRHRALWSRTHTLKCQERKPQPRRPEPETRRITVKSRTTYGVSTVLYISIYFTHRTHAHYAPPRRPAARGRARPRARPRGPPPPPPPARVFLSFTHRPVL